MAEGIRHGEAEAKARLDGYAALRVVARLRISEREGKDFLMAIFVCRRYLPTCWFAGLGYGV